MKLLMTCVVVIMVVYAATHVSAQWIAGYVEDAFDGTSPDGRTARVWSPVTLDEGFDTIGPSGASQTPNVYMVNCGVFATPCQVGDSLNITIVDDGSGYVIKQIEEVVVTSAGFTIVGSNLTMNSPPQFTNTSVEDGITSPSDEIDLTPASTTNVSCTTVVTDYDGDSSIVNASSEMYAPTSFPGDSDDNNLHYTNASCSINETYGSAIETQITCGFQIEYYAVPGSWNCQINVTDNYTASNQSVDASTVNTLLAIGVDSPLSFGVVDVNNISSEQIAQVTNYGNVMMNLSLSGYGENSGDGDAMVCQGNNISVGYTKYNLTYSNPGVLNLTEAEMLYTNLTSNPVIEEFNLNARQNDVTNDAQSDTYWRTYVPSGVTSSCTGNIVFGAAQL